MNKPVVLQSILAVVLLTVSGCSKWDEGPVAVGTIEFTDSNGKPTEGSVTVKPQYFDEYTVEAGSDGKVTVLVQAGNSWASGWKHPSKSIDVNTDGDWDATWEDVTSDGSSRLAPTSATGNGTGIVYAPSDSDTVEVVSPEQFQVRVASHFDGYGTNFLSDRGPIFQADYDTVVLNGTGSWEVKFTNEWHTPEHVAEVIGCADVEQLSGGALACDLPSDSSTDGRATILRWNESDSRTSSDGTTGVVVDGMRVEFADSVLATAGSAALETDFDKWMNSMQPGLGGG